MTKIEWTDETWNPVTGCTKVSAGCKNCYAERIWPRVAGAELSRMLPRRESHIPRAFTDVRCHPERLNAPLHWNKPRRIFVNSMSDLFHEDVPDEFILQVFEVMRACENGYSFQLDRRVSLHTFQILTKRPARMLDFCTRLRFAQNDARGMYLAKTLPHNGFNLMPLLRHVWLGVSVEDQDTADERIPPLLQTPAAVRFISYEPALGPINFYEFFEQFPDHNEVRVVQRHTGIDWVIAGGESGPNARPPHPDWFRTLRDQCADADVPFFFKQWGEWAPDIREFQANRMFRFGKKAAGRALDGRLHDEFPA